VLCAILFRLPKIWRCISPLWRPPCLHLIARPRRPAPTRTAAPRGGCRPGDLRRGRSRSVCVSACACELVGSKAGLPLLVPCVPASHPLLRMRFHPRRVLVQMSSMLKLDGRWRTRWVAGTHSESALYIVILSSKCTRALTFENVWQSPTARSSTGKTRRISGVERPTKGINPKSRTPNPQLSTLKYKWSGEAHKGYADNPKP
jgi:hypothetical protein